MEHIRELQTHPWLSPSYRDQEPFVHHQRAYNSKSCETFVVRQQHAICWYHTAWICMSSTHASERTHTQYLCIILVRAAYMTTTSRHELMMGDTWNSYRLMWCLVIMASLLCFSKCRGCITLWEWAPSMWKDGGRLGAQLRPALLLPVSILFWDGERVTIFNS